MATIIRSILEAKGYKTSDRFVFFAFRKNFLGQPKCISSKNWDFVRGNVGQDNIDGWRFYLVSDLYGMYSLDQNGTNKVDVYPNEQYEIACALGLDVSEQTPLPEGREKNPFGRFSMGSWGFSVDAESRVYDVRHFNLQECRWAMAMTSCQKTVIRACQTRIRELYKLDGSLYPTPPDTLAFVRRLAVEEGSHLHVDSLHQYICELSGCGVDTVAGKRHRKSFLTLLAEGHLQFDKVTDFVTITEVNR